MTQTVESESNVDVHGSGQRKPAFGEVSNTRLEDRDEIVDPHLPDLRITAFRGIDELHIPELGRVTLVVGKNGVGKTTVLEAIRVYSARGQASSLASILRERGELSTRLDAHGSNINSPDWPALFHGRDIRSNGLFSIGPTEVARQLHVEAKPLSAEEMSSIERYIRGPLPDSEMLTLRVTINDSAYKIPIEDTTRNSVGFPSQKQQMMFENFPLFSGNTDIQSPSNINCINIGPSTMTNDEIARLWADVALTDDEDRAIEALKLVFGHRIERVAVVSRDESRRNRRNIMVRISDLANPVPLKSLGDGAIRFFGTSLALATSRNGFLTIDEAENGVHYMLQSDYWRMVLKTAQRNNVQVIATTHGWDCVRGFARAVADSDEITGTLIRLEHTNGSLRAVRYPKDTMLTAAAQGIEVR